MRDEQPTAPPRQAPAKVESSSGFIRKSGVAVAGVIVVLIGSMVVFSSWALLREALAVLMESAPAHIDVEEVRAELGELRGVIDVHDLHVWTVGTGMVSLSGHVVAKDGFADGGLLREVDDLLSRRFGIEHTTIQIESVEFAQSDTACCE